MNFEDLFRSQLDFIEKVIQVNCRRSHFSKEECEDFRGRVMTKLVENDYAVFRKWNRRSKIETYLTAVIGHECSDFRNHLWGKWRPSRAAVKMGPVAARLEELIVRDGLTQSEAFRIILDDPRFDVAEEDLEEILSRLPRRTRRSFVGEHDLEGLQHQDPDPEQQLLDEEEEEARFRIQERLEECREKLSEENQLLLRLRYEDGIKVAQIARMFATPQRPLYSKMDRLKRFLRKCLEEPGAGTRPGFVV